MLRSHRNAVNLAALTNATGTGSVARLAIARSAISRNGSTAINMVSATGTLTAVVTDNTIVRNSGQGGVNASGRASAPPSATTPSRAITPTASGKRRTRCSRLAATTSCRTTRPTSPAR